MRNDHRSDEKQFIFLSVLPSAEACQCTKVHQNISEIATCELDITRYRQISARTSRQTRLLKVLSLNKNGLIDKSRVYLKYFWVLHTFVQN